MGKLFMVDLGKLYENTCDSFELKIEHIGHRQEEFKVLEWNEYGDTEADYVADYSGLLEAFRQYAIERKEKEAKPVDK